MSTVKYFVFLISMMAFLTSCQPQVQETGKDGEGSSSNPPAESPSTPDAPTRRLYVASGQCYSGSGITTFNATTASNLIFKVNTTTGIREGIIADYYAAPAAAGDTPLSLVEWDAHNLLVFVRNGTKGGIEVLPKQGGIRNVFGTNPAISTILATAPQAMQKSSDGGLLLIRTGFIEKLNASGIRQASPHVNNNLGATCGTSNALYTNIAVSNNGYIITANAAASPNNRLISVPGSGASGSCSSGVAAPAATTYATALVFDRTHGKLIVAYAGNTIASANINSIHAYDFDETTGAISNDQTIYDANQYPTVYPYLLFGISAMTLDEETNSLYVATAISNATTAVNYAIEKFTYNAAKIGVTNSEVLTRSGSLPFYNYGADTKCISSMVVGSESVSLTK